MPRSGEKGCLSAYKIHGFPFAGLHLAISEQHDFMSSFRPWTWIAPPFELIGRHVVLAVASLRYLPSLPRQWKRLVEHCGMIGYQTVPIVAILSFFIGAVLAIQSGFALVQVNAEQFIGAIVGLSLARELGPVMTAFLVAGRVGSSVTAEIASMKVYQEIDALRTMNIPPEKFLVMPRLVAILLVMPILTIISIVIGWWGGQVVSYAIDFIQLEPTLYWRGLDDFIDASDIIDGLIKAQIFGFFVLLIACQQGMQTSGGPREVGDSVTRAVVYSMIFILFSDYWITRILL